MVSLSPVYDHFLTYIVEHMSAEDILSFEIPADAAARAIELLDKQDQSTLSAQEAEELTQMQQADRLIAALKARAFASRGTV